MTLEENVLKIINKLNTMSGKMLSFEKRLKTEEAKSIGFHEDLLSINEDEKTPCFESTGDFAPNAKFLKWYSEVFKEEVEVKIPTVAEFVKVAVELEEELHDPSDIVEEEVSPEVLKKLDEVVDNG